MLPAYDPRPLDVEEQGLYHLGEAATRPPFATDGARPMFRPPPDRDILSLTFSERPTFHSCHPDGMLYGVVDAAQDFEWAFTSHEEGYDLVSLFLGKQAPELIDAAPYFFAVREGAPLLARWEAAIGTNLGVLVESPADARDVFAHLREIFVVRKEDAQEYFFRYYDPRVLRTYLPTCNRAELADFFGPLTGLIAESADGSGLELFRPGDRGDLEVRRLGLIDLVEPRQARRA